MESRKWMDDILDDKAEGEQEASSDESRMEDPSKIQDFLHRINELEKAGKIACHEHNAVNDVLFYKGEDILLALLYEVAAVQIESHEEGYNIIAQHLALLGNAYKYTVHVVIEHISSYYSYSFSLLHSAHLPIRAYLNIIIIQQKSEFCNSFFYISTKCHIVMLFQRSDL